MKQTANGTKAAFTAPATAIQPSTNGHDSAPPPALSTQVEQLAASLGTVYPGGNQPYSPDAFLNAIKQRHDTLCKVADELERRHEAQVQREQDLTAREARVKFQEERLGAAQALAGKGWRFW